MTIETCGAAAMDFGDGSEKNEPGAAAVPSGSAPSVPTIASLFLVCLKIGMLSFGGGLSGWIHREFVVLHGWVSDEDFINNLAVSQMLPGPNVVNLVIFLGHQLRGVLGSIGCVVGFVIGPFFAVIALSALYDSITNVGLLQAASNGVAFAAIGLILVMCLQGARRAIQFPPSLGIIAVPAIAIGVLHFPLVPVVLLVAPVSVALAWRRL